MQFLLLVIYLFTLPYAIADKQEHLKIGVAQIPPYSYRTPSGEFKGLEVEIVRTCFKGSPYQVEFVQYPYGRLPFALAKRQIDGQTVTLVNKETVGIYYSDIVAPEYQAVAISLAKNKLQLNSITDLKGHTIVAHQRAKTYYGAEFEQIAIQAGSAYKEYANQLNQIHLLYSDLTDVIVISENIFNHLKRRADFDISAAIKIDAIFGDKRGFNNAFTSKEVRDKFNRCLKQIKADGRYRKLVQQAFK